MITKQIGKLLRGGATPAQIMLACVLGSLLGFVPGFSQAGGLIVVLFLGLTAFNANLAVATVVGGMAKVVSVVLMPVSFGVGRLLLDGPTQGLFKAMINLPVLALLGLENYVTTGGLIVGGLFGLLMGWGLIRTIQGFRSKMAGLESNSERYKAWMGKWWVKLLIYVLVGKKAKGSYEELLVKKGKVIRPVGVVFAVLVLVLMAIVQMFFGGAIVRAAMQGALERSNGATVDIASMDVDLKGGRITIEGLAMADRNDLSTDLFRAQKVEIDISGADLLRKRVSLDKVVLVGSEHGAKRAVAGRLVGPATAEPVDQEPKEGTDDEQGKALEDYLEDAKRWKARLAQVQGWIEQVSGYVEPAGGQDGAGGPGTLSDWLEQQIREKGYANVSADHLIEGAPRLLIRELIAQGIQTGGLGGETIDLHGENLSTNPGLSDKVPRLVVRSSGQTLSATLDLAGAASGGGASTLDFSYRGLAVDGVTQGLVVGGDRPIAGGHMDLAMRGKIRTQGGIYIDLPLLVTLNNTTVTVPGVGSTKVKKLELPLGVRGRLSSPRVSLDHKALKAALMKAGADMLAGRLKGKTGMAIEEGKKTAKDALGGKIGEQAEGVLGLFGRKKEKKK